MILQLVVLFLFLVVGAIYSWDFGDGQTATGTSVTHVFATEGLLNVILTITDTNDCSNSNIAQQAVFINPAPIAVDNPVPLLTAQELIEDVLVTTDSCAEIEFLVDGTYTSGGNRTIGYFTNTNTTFPFSEGIILSSGWVGNAEASEENTSGTQASDDTPGNSDVQLMALSPPAVSSINDATYVTFKFRTSQDHINFRYLFASEEYEGGNNYACSFADVFAFIISGPGIADTNPYQLEADSAVITNVDAGGKNIALIPGTIIPVSVTNVFDYYEAASCTGLNTEYYESNWAANFKGAIEYNGYTQAFTAESDVVPNEWYTIKLAIGDANDGILDSAVFLEASSFGLGIELPDDLTFNTGAEVCGENIDITVEGPVGISYQWSHNGTPIVGATNATYTASVIEVGGFGDGTYTVEVDFGSSCVVVDDIEIEFATIPVIGEIPPFLVCDTTGEGFGEFDLSSYDATILDGQNPSLFDVSYYLSEDNLNNNIPIITPITNNEANTMQTIWVQLSNSLSPDCLINSSFEIGLADSPIFNQPPNVSLCGLSGSNAESFDFTSQTAIIIGSQTDMAVTYHSTLDDAENGINSLTNQYSKYE